MAPSNASKAAPAFAGSDLHKSSCLARPRPASQAETGLNKTSLQGSFDSPEISTKSGPAKEVCCDLIRDDLCDNIGAMIATLNAALAMRDAADDVGLLYGLRRARAYWQAIAGSARELAGAEAERRSAMRQGDGGQ